MSRKSLSGATVVVGIEGVEGVHEMLRQWSDPKKTDARDLRATRAAARVLKTPLKSAAAPLSSRMARSVYVHKMRGSKSAMIVGHHKKVSRGPKGDFWPMVIGGTVDHGPRKAAFLVFINREGRKVVTSRVRGVPAHPIVEQVVSSYGARALDTMIDEIEKG